ncbi:MAG: molybdopterin molybdotransferase MoeA [Deltaproteobacteria bacterium]|nr:molybdopterin molybdotransferase MoeA [Deltaproteobacteria bacterium]
MDEFFRVVSIADVLALAKTFPGPGRAEVDLASALGRILAADAAAPEDLPAFSRSTMDGYALAASSTFGASASSPALLEVAGSVPMGAAPGFSLAPGQAAAIPTGGMLPAGADAVVMVEHTEKVDEALVEVYKSVAPGDNVLTAGEDAAKGSTVLSAGTRLRAQELALLAALGITRVTVAKPLVAGILSTGDEVVPAEETPGPGKIRDMNAHALAAQCRAAGIEPLALGIVPDDEEALHAACRQALPRCDTLLVSGGSSVGARDYTVSALTRFSGAEILVHGVAISPGKPTILARVQDKPVWGLPGHVTSSMVVFHALVRPFSLALAGFSEKAAREFPVACRLAKNVAAAAGRVDFVRVALSWKDGELWATPIPGKSGEIRTMVAADALVPVDENTEGLDAGTLVHALPLS